MKRGPLIRMAGTVLLLVAMTSAAAQVLRDPTRPPGRSPAKAAPGLVSGGFVLQSILNSPERKAAVINGKVLGPGESVDGFMLVGIAEDEAVLKNGSDVRRLRLYPSVNMKKYRQAQQEGAAATAPGTTQ